MNWTGKIFRGITVAACLVAGVLFSVLFSSSASAATPDDIEQAIETGVAWLAAQQDTTNGYWEDGSNRAGPTGLALVKLQERAFELGYTPFDSSYPYHENVEKGLAYLFSTLGVMNISTQPAGNPDTDGDGKGVYVNAGYITYDTGIAMMAIASSRSPDRVVNAPGKPVDGWTYKQVLVDMVDYMAYGQYDYAPSRGGWGYSDNESNVDNSNSGYAVSGLGYAESARYGFECAIPQFVKDELIFWADYVQTDGGSDEDGGSGYTAPGVGNILRTGNLVCQMTFAGRPADHTNVQRASDYIGRKWNESNQNPGWGNPDYYSGSPHYQAMYCAANGLSYARIEMISVNSQPRDWYADFADAIVNVQETNGSWASDPHGGAVLATAWALLTLERPAYILDFEKADDVDENDCRSPGQEITYTICWDNQGDRTFSGAWIIDRLPQGVTYTGGQWLYDPNEHTCTIDIGDIGPWDANCVSLTVIVNSKAEPGVMLHNVADLYSQDMWIARTTEDTLVCCWDTGPIIYVDKDALGNDNGVSWIDAYTDLQRALARARDTQCADVNTIYIADGTYSPGVFTGSSFEIPNGISVYGSFAGVGFPDPYYRNPRQFPTILSGYINETARNETVVVMGDETLLDGVTVKEADNYAIFGIDADFTIENCRVEDNKQWGVWAENGNVSVKWCSIKNNGYDGIDYFGNGENITIENCQINDNLRYGIYLEESVSTIKNSVICKNGIDNSANYFGIRLVNPVATPSLYNNTIAYNYNEAIAFTDNGTVGDPNDKDWPDVQNCIVYYNNASGGQFAGIDFATHYCCIQDPNSDPYGLDYTPDAFGNITGDPEFAYADCDYPNAFSNAHLSYNSPCKDTGNPSHNSDDIGLYDMDNESRITDDRVDIGADEIYSCDSDLSEDDIYNPRDWNADGIVNLDEFNPFSSAWLSRDPNDPHITTDPNNIGQPNYADPNTIAQWRLTWNPRCDLNDSNDIDLADLIIFIDDTPWLWEACWHRSLWERFGLMYYAMSGGEQMMSMPATEPETMSEQPMQTELEPPQTVEEPPLPEPPQEPNEPQMVEESSIEQQIADLQDAIQFLETIWDENPDIGQEIQPDDWQAFMDAVYNSLTELEQSDIITSEVEEEQ